MSENQEVNGTETGKRSKKLSKDIQETVVVITVLGGTKGEQRFDFTTLPAEIQAKLGPFGLGHKLGDAAAGKEGTEAEESIQKVWDGLMANDWSVRAPQGPRVSVKALTDKISNLSAADQEAAKALLASLGVKLPGME